MASWFQSHLDFAEGLLDKVDKQVSSAVARTSAFDRGDGSQAPSSSQDAVAQSRPRLQVGPSNAPLRDAKVVGQQRPASSAVTSQQDAALAPQPALDSFLSLHGIGTPQLPYRAESSSTAPRAAVDISAPAPLGSLQRPEQHQHTRPTAASANSTAAVPDSRPAGLMPVRFDSRNTVAAAPTETLHRPPDAVASRLPAPPSEATPSQLLTETGTASESKPARPVAVHAPSATVSSTTTPRAAADGAHVADSTSEEPAGGAALETGKKAGKSTAGSKGTSAAALPIDSNYSAARNPPLHAADALADEAARERESRLTRVVETLKGRLEELRAENAQLEALVQEAESERELHAAEGARCHREACAARNELRALAAQQDAAEQRALAAESRMENAEAARASLQEQVKLLQQQNAALASEHAQREHDGLEGIRRELEETHSALDAQIASSAQARSAACATQEHLETQLQQAIQAASVAQRLADTAAEQREEMELQLQAARAEASHAHAQLREHEAMNSPDSGAKAELAALQNQLEAAQAKRLAAEAALEAAAARLEVMQGQLTAAQAVAADSAVTRLRRQIEESNELLVHKQSQLERVSAEKAAQTMALERQLAHAHEQLEMAARQSRALEARETMTRSDDIVPMDTLGLYSRFASSQRFGGAVQAVSGALDNGAATLVTLLRRRPVARLILLVYLLCIHLFVYILIGQMQRMALRQEERLISHDGAHEPLM